MVRSCCENCIIWNKTVDQIYAPEDDIIKEGVPETGHYCPILDTFKHRIPPDVWENGCNSFHSRAFIMTEKMAREYHSAFGSMPFYAEPSNVLVVEDGNGTLYRIEDSEAVFLDRIRRSKEIGRNLFFEECKPIDPYPDPDTDY